MRHLLLLALCASPLACFAVTTDGGTCADAAPAASSAPNPADAGAIGDLEASASANAVTPDNPCGCAIYQHCTQHQCRDAITLFLRLDQVDDRTVVKTSYASGANAIWPEGCFVGGAAPSVDNVSHAGTLRLETSTGEVLVLAPGEELESHEWPKQSLAPGDRVHVTGTWGADIGSFSAEVVVPTKPSGFSVSPPLVVNWKPENRSGIGATFSQGDVWCLSGDSGRIVVQPPLDARVASGGTAFLGAINEVRVRPASAGIVALSYMNVATFPLD